MTHYLYWQFVGGPIWLATFALNVQRMLVRSFSVPVMLKTLVAHWHRDAVPYKGGSMSSYALAFAWNLISRAIGFIVRSVMLVLWLVSASIAVILNGALIALFLLWPFMALGAIGVGILMLVA